MIASHLRYVAGPLDVQWCCYSNGRPAILLTHRGLPACKPSVNLPEAELAIDEIAIKDYAENEGAAATLVHAGIIEPRPLRILHTRHVQFQIYRLTPIAKLALRVAAGGPAIDEELN